jgi:molybdopterin converting factor small subunit
MRVTVRLYGTLRRFLPAGTDNAVLELHEGAAVAHAIAALRIPPQSAQMIISGENQLHPASLLHDGQEISLFPPLAGGC